MTALYRLFGPVRQAFAAFFRHDVALRRAGDGLHLVLEERNPATPRPPSRAEVSARKESTELELIRTQLAELLDELPETRTTLRHLVFVERALAKKGLRALHKLPLDVLQRALEQFEGLVLNWSPAGLASLRSKMAVAIIDREHMDPDAEADAYRTAAVLDSTPPPDDEPAAAESRSDDEALAAAYAALALGEMGSSVQIETHVELGSQSARAITREVTRPLDRQPSVPDQIKLRELQE